MSKEHFSTLITKLIQSQEGARELWDQIQDMRSSLELPGVFNLVRSGVNWNSYSEKVILDVFLIFFGAHPRSRHLENSTRIRVLLQQMQC